MRKYSTRITVLCAIVCLVFTIAGCSKKESQLKGKLLGNWTRSINRNYILLIFRSDGTWESSVRISDATSKIVSGKGKATGTWVVEENNIIFSVNESDIEDVWKKNAINYYEILLLEEASMELKSETGQIIKYSHHLGQKKTEEQVNTAPVIPMKPIVVNLNKNRSHDKDRYFCVNMNLILQELMPGSEIPKIHPRTRDAAIMFLSSLIFEDVKDFDRVKEQKKKLIEILNPYMEGAVKDIEIDHVLIASSIDRVEAFIIEHTMTGKQDESETDTQKKEGNIQIQDGSEEEKG